MVSAASEQHVGPFNPEKARLFVAGRESVALELASYLQTGKQKLHEARQQGLIDRKTAKRIFSGIADSEEALVRERTALAKNRIKIEYGILSHPTHATVAEAYLASLVETLPEPTGAPVKKQGPRANSDQEQFKRLVRRAYVPTLDDFSSDAPFRDPAWIWCPVTKAWHQSLAMKTAQLVPCSIGELNASYIFGLPQDEGW